MAGTLYVCGTPIGNLSDISYRVVEILNNVDFVAAEDTRHSLKLLNHLGINKKLISYHEHNKREKGQYLISLLEEGNDIALVTDAGMPGISDPGEDLIKLCYENDIKIVLAPGPTAVISGLVLSGLPTKRYVFDGFLPKANRERKKMLESYVTEERTIVLYESPHNLKNTLRDIKNILPLRRISAVREITKKYEEVVSGSVSEVLDIFEKTEVRGEFVLVLEGATKESVEQIQKDMWNDISIEEHMNIYLSKNFDNKNAMKEVAKDRKVSKREIYNYLNK